MSHRFLSAAIAFSLCLAAASAAERKVDIKSNSGFARLFPDDGAPKGWRLSDWSDVSKPAPAGAAWKVEDGILHGSTPRGTWLISEKVYGDFILDFEFKLGPQGNSGCGIRFPDAGDPAFDGLEIQMVDRRYYPPSFIPGPDELTGSIYKAMAPIEQVYKPTEWNHYRIACVGPRVTIFLNGQMIQDTNLDANARQLERGTPLKDRPRRGHIGFQELSRGGGHVQIRDAKIKVLDE